MPVAVGSGAAAGRVPVPVLATSAGVAATAAPTLAPGSGGGRVNVAAGIAAKMHMNPFDALTTITVKIVNQLTGDHEFGSPETLVAFALGLSLFVITLMLNVYALYIVRKYREQYD